MCLLQGYSKWSEDYYQQNCDGFYIHLHEYKISFEAHEVSCVQVSFINLLHKFLFAFLFVAPKQIL